jgi:hypothetical protein
MKIHDFKIPIASENVKSHTIILFVFLFMFNRFSGFVVEGSYKFYSN